MSAATWWEARHYGRCKLCDGPINPGDPITSTLAGWVHAEACPDDAEPLTGAVCPKCFLTRSLSGECGCDE